MTTDPKNDPGSRLRNILSSGEEEPAPKTEEASPIARLPRRAQAGGSAPSTPEPVPAPQPSSPPESTSRQTHSRVERTYRAFWTVTGLMSLLVNGILLGIVVYLGMSLNSLKTLSDNKDLMILSGLYTNFQRMERASIVTSITVQDSIPIDLTVPIQKTTQIRLASDTTIPNARVRINTATLNIDAPAQVILPSGTVLEVALDFNVPVQGSVPINLTVPVNIPLAQTELQTPFSNLQKVVKPFLCIIEPLSVDLDNKSICQ